METKQLILLGPPGVGVNAQSAAIAEHWHVPYVSMGELLRGAIANASEIGLEAQAAVDAGELVPDALVMKLLRKRFEQPDIMLQGWVLDGFPRTLAQAQTFDEWSAAVGLPAAPVAYLKAMTGLLVNRIWTEKENYSYDSTAAIRRHLSRHQDEVAPLLKYYQQRSQLKTINGSLPFAEVARALTRLGQAETGAAQLIQDEAELDSHLAQESKLVVDCMASWCGSCKQVTPLMDQLAEAYRDRVTVMKIDFDINRQITKRFGLKGIPAVMFFNDGELLETLIGVKSYQDYSAAAERLLG
ncbi:MAG: nucleoside monophosphate kinase [Elainellaceae cyanobacterium]